MCVTGNIEVMCNGILIIGFKLLFVFKLVATDQKFIEKKNKIENYLP